MADRVQVRDLYKDKGFAPSTQTTARPVDTFVTPVRPTQDLKLMELARAFQDVEPGLSKFAQQRIDHSNDIDVEEGQKAALANKAQFKEAINAGVIPAGVSPWFKVGWERQKARLDSHGYNQALQEAYASSDMATKDDPQALQGFMATFTAKWLQDNPTAQENPEFNSTFSMMSSKAQEGLAQQHTVERVKAVEQETYANTDREVGLLLEDHQNLLGEPNPQTPALVAALVKSQIENGLNGSTANKLVADAVIRQAVAENDITILDLLDQIPSGSGTVGQIGYVKDDVQRARDAITSQKAAQDRHAKASRALDNKEAVQSIQNEANLQIMKDPRSDLSGLFAKMSAVDADEANKMIAHQSAYLSAMAAKDKIVEDPLEKTQMTIRALQGDLTSDEVYAAVQQGTIDADSARSLLSESIPKGKEHKTVFQDPVFIRISKGIRDVITKNELADDFADQRAYRASEADLAFSQGMIEFRDANPKATHLDMLKHGKDLRDTVLDLYREDSAEDLPTPLEKAAPEEDKMFSTSESLDAALDEYNGSKGTRGKLKALSDKLGIPANDIYAAQHKLLPKPQPKKK